jgi:hypothetical protein
MGASPELFREVDGSRIAAVSVSSEALRRQHQCALSTIGHQAVAYRWAFDEQSLVQNNAVTGICCPCSDAEFVQVNIENRTMDFVPRFSNMHGSVESHATR